MSSNVVIKDFSMVSDNIGEASISDFTVNKYCNSIVFFSLKNQRSSARLGNAKVKAMSEISGTTAKPFKQKGTGNARQGSKRSVQMRGGRSCFGPTGSENYQRKTIKKIAKKSISLILLDKIKENNIYSFSDYENINKSSIISKFLKKNNLKKSLFIVDKASLANNALFFAAIRNVPNCDIVDFRSINAYILLNFNNIIIQNNILDGFFKKYRDELS